MIRFKVETVRVLIHANPVVAFEDLSDADREIEGTYKVNVSAQLDPSQWADAALDAFHGSVPIDDESHFEFIVENTQGELLVGCLGHRHESLMDEAWLV